jgi:hypothetical protein
MAAADRYVAGYFCWSSLKEHCRPHGLRNELGRGLGDWSLTPSTRIWTSAVRSAVGFSFPIHDVDGDRQMPL